MSVATRILIVDDNASNVKLARLLLENSGFDVRVANDSQEALEILGSFSPRMILMDIQLPGMDGLTLTRHLRQDGIAKDTIVVAVTAYAMEGDEERAKAAGCDGYISKPINTRTFVDQVRSYLKQPPEKAVAQPASDPNDLLRELRNEFLADAMESSRRYALDQPIGGQTDMMRRMAHHWAGTGGTLGFPEVTAVARTLEEIIETHPPGWEKQTSQLFAELNSIFTGLMATGGAAAMPKALEHAFISKQIGLVGFHEAESARLISAFATVHATARDLGALRQGLGMDALREHDLIVLNASSDEGADAWDSVSTQPVLEHPILVVASRSALLDSKLALMDRATDFVLEPWDAEEILCRAQKVICQDPEPRPQKSQRNAKPTVILADDDPIIHRLLTPMFNKMGIDCYSAYDGNAARDAANSLSPDLLILDVVMPGMSGMSLLREIRKERKNSRLPILMLSARQQRSDISMALAYGANDYVVKPFDPEDIVLRVKRLLSHEAGPTDENRAALAQDLK